MKKTVTKTAIVLGLAFLAQVAGLKSAHAEESKTVYLCTVSVESSPGMYNKNLAKKAVRLESLNTPQVILDDGSRSYILSLNESGDSVSLFIMRGSFKNITTLKPHPSYVMSLVGIESKYVALIDSRSKTATACGKYEGPYADQVAKDFENGN